MNHLLNTKRRRTYLRNVLIEMSIYGVLLVIYFLLVLRFLGDFLFDLFNNQLVVYGFVGLGLIVAQGILLETITSFLIRLLRLDRLD